MIAPESLDLASLPSLPLADKRSLPEISAIYFAVDQEGVVRYIGRSTNLRQRWATHHRFYELTKVAGFNIAWLSISDETLLPDIEKALIKYYAPPLNGKENLTQTDDGGVVVPETGIVIYLRKLRELRGLSQNALARKTGYTLQHIQKFEQGKVRSISLDFLGVVCEALNCHPGDLFGRKTL